MINAGTFPGNRQPATGNQLTPRPPPSLPNLISAEGRGLPTRPERSNGTRPTNHISQIRASPLITNFDDAAITIPRVRQHVAAVLVTIGATKNAAVGDASRSCRGGTQGTQ